MPGGTSFGLLYLDGVVRLAGDTSITANDVFIGPDAQLQTCCDSTAGNNCVNGRSLTINASGGVAISPAIDLRGHVGANRAGGRSPSSAARVSLGGLVETAGTNAPSGSISIDSPGSRRHADPARARAPASSVHGAGGVLIGGDVWSAGSDTATRPDPTAPTSGGGIDLASSGGDVNVLGSIASWGRDVTGAGAVAGRQRRPRHVSGGDVRISGGIDSRAGRGVDISAGQPGAIDVAARGA